MATFSEIGIEDRIIKAIEELGFEQPMPVQEKVIAHLMRNDYEDVIALAQTGTGKTAAFGLPLIQKIDTNAKYPQSLVLCPTRELCLQIKEDLTNYSKYLDNVNIAAVYGGASMEQQIKSIKKGAQIISATPGRLVDLINRKVIDLKKIKTVVLDEADEMLSMGFREELETILKETAADKNTLLFSATMPDEIRTITKRYMKNPVEISVGKRNAGAENVNHVCYMVHAKDRYLALKRIADYFPDIYGIIFCRTRNETKDVAEKLIKDGYNAEAIHGDLSQAQRDAVMSKFRIKHLKLLVATDVAARGIDVDNLSHIINYNLPDEPEIYTHRSGRTGRAGKNGTSIVIANLKEKNKLRQIENKINKKFQFSEIPAGNEICERQLFHLVDKMESAEVDHKEIDQFLPAINEKLEHLSKEEIIKKFVSLEFNRFLEYYKNNVDLNHPNEAKSKGRSSSTSDNYTRFFINLGKTDDLKPAVLIGMINDFTNVRNIEIGEIEILRNFSFFETDSEYTETILSAFQNKSFKKREIGVEIAGPKKGGSSKKRNKGSKNLDSGFNKKRKSKSGRR